MLKWGFHAVKENNIWQVGVEGLTLTSLVSQSHFPNIHFSGSQQLCFRGAQEELFRSLYQVWNGASSQIWMTSCRKCMEYVCLLKGGSQMSWEVFPSFPSTVSQPAQISREKSRGEAAGKMPALGAFGSPLQQELGVFFCIPLLWSCQQVKHSAVFLRAAETWCAQSPPLAELAWPCLAPCLEWGRFNPLGSPDGSPRLGQAWGAVLLHLARGKKTPPAACNC